MVRSPARTTPGSVAGLADSTLPTARRSRASTSAGPAVSRSTSLTPHSADSPASPPSVSTAKTGAVMPVVCMSRVSERAAMRSRRASTSTASVGAVSSRAEISSGATRTVWDSRPSAGSTSAEGCIALVRSRRVAMGASSDPSDRDCGKRRRCLPARLLDVDRLRTADGQLLRARWYDGPGSTGVVLAHGFSGSIDKPAARRVARALSAYAPVLAYDARGHGRSTGVTTLGDLEVLDVDAAVAAARKRCARVVTCGWSMGGSTVIRHAALRGEPVSGHRVEFPPDAVVSVSATSRWFVRDTAAMRRLHWVVERRAGRAYARG